MHHLKFVFLAALLMAAAVAGDDWSPSQCACGALEYALCGTDGKNYGSPCELECRDGYLRRTTGKGVDFKKTGKCEDPEVPFYIDSSCCGS